ncbi:peptidylprolyl isomerase [Gilliamella sp. W8129]|nr:MULTISPECIES: peptidylprolyl isomerase [unclassified Gilliamella]KES16529.1 Peptidyl-prolyl cis-trans isomerase (rotamase) - cyclophilin family [Gilliamella apis SCGC AB-598-P17]MBI0113969.1 peptidylprolyl isomerase [Gilliamella sp. W8123]MBI0117506.1 peptidylprolyl isomerase [Gilliamella sp. W8129]MBI0156673.1 peptidylprolyl isomerase [Gilliamella sp. M0364]
MYPKQLLLLISLITRKYGYAVFGKVIKGIDIVDKIVSIATKRMGPYQNVPVEPIYIKK